MRIKTSFILVFIIFIMAAGAVFAETPREQLKQMVEQLQKNPADNALREMIIKLAQEVKPAPAVPEDAVEFEGRAQFAFNNAKSNDDYLAAAREYEKAVAAAPWVTGYYSDLCTIYEKAGKFEDAKRNCEFSLVGLTDSAQITDIKRRIAGLKYGIEQKAKEDEAKSRENEAKLQRQRWASGIVQWLKSNYGGRVERIWVGSFPQGQPDSGEWYAAQTDDCKSEVLLRENMRFTYLVTGNDMDQVQITDPRFSTFLDCGTPYGPEVSNVKWRYCGSDEMMKQGPQEVWFDFSSSSKSGKPFVQKIYGCKAGRCGGTRYLLEN